MACEANEIVASRCSSLACAKAAMPPYDMKKFTSGGGMGITRKNLTKKHKQCQGIMQ